MEYLENDLTKFDLWIKYPRGTLLLRESYPKHAALIYKNPEDQDMHITDTYNPRFTSIVHLVLYPHRKELKLEGLFNVHLRESIGKYEEYIHAPFEYACTPDKWLQ